MLDAETIERFVEAIEKQHEQRRESDARLVEIYHRARAQRIDVAALKSIVQARRNGSCDDVLKTYRAIARNAAPPIEADPLAAVLGPLSA